MVDTFRDKAVTRNDRISAVFNCSSLIHVRSVRTVIVHIHPILYNLPHIKGTLPFPRRAFLMRRKLFRVMLNHIWMYLD